jgi:hypothetical protein
MSPTAQVASIGLTIGFFMSAWLGQKTVDDWVRDSGRKPMIQGKGRWSAYMRANRHEMPRSIARRLSILTWIGSLALILIVVVFALDGSHRR